MYHIPEDERSKKSAFKIYQSLRHNLWHKCLMDITVSDIYKESGIARTTFYRLFDNVTDVLEYQFEIYMNEYNSLKEKEKDKILFFFEYFDKHSDLVSIIAKEDEYILKKVIEKNTENVSDYKVALKIGMMTSLLSAWTKNNKTETPKQMAEITKRILSGNLSDLLTNL